MLETAPLRPAQITAVEGAERSLAEQRFDRSLIQMATGAGKTFTAVTLAYRLLAYAGFNRILFLVDRNNLGEQTMAEFQNYRTPGDGRRFTEIYAVDKLTSAGMLGSSNVVVSTIQRVFKALQGDEITADDDPGLDGYTPDRPVTVDYNAAMPPEAFDLVVVDEAHRSIYGVWRGVLEYFDAHVIGLTATPGKQTFAFFRQNLVSEYAYPQSVADRVNVDVDLYRIRTEITEQGAIIDAGTIVPKIDRRTRVQRLEALDDELEYRPGQLDRSVTAKSQIRTVLGRRRHRRHHQPGPTRTRSDLCPGEAVRHGPDRDEADHPGLRRCPDGSSGRSWRLHHDRVVHPRRYGRSRTRQRPDRADRRPSAGRTDGDVRRRSPARVHSDPVRGRRGLFREPLSTVSMSLA